MATMGSFREFGLLSQVYFTAISATSTLPRPTTWQVLAWIQLQLVRIRLISFSSITASSSTKSDGSGYATLCSVGKVTLILLFLILLLAIATPSSACSIKMQPPSRTAPDLQPHPIAADASGEAPRMPDPSGSRGQGSESSSHSPSLQTLSFRSGPNSTAAAEIFSWLDERGKRARPETSDSPSLSGASTRVASARRSTSGRGPNRQLPNSQPRSRRDPLLESLSVEIASNSPSQEHISLEADHTNGSGSETYLNPSSRPPPTPEVESTQARGGKRRRPTPAAEMGDASPARKQPSRAVNLPPQHDIDLLNQTAELHPDLFLEADGISDTVKRLITTQDYNSWEDFYHTTRVRRNSEEYHKIISVMYAAKALDDSVMPDDTVFSQNSDRSQVHRSGQQPTSSPDLGDQPTPSTSGTGGPNRTTQTPDITQRQSEDLGQAPRPIQTDDAIVCPLCHLPFSATDMRQRRRNFCEHLNKCIPTKGPLTFQQEQRIQL